jgi:hypothetical protein
LIVFQNGHISGALAELIRSTRAPTKDRLIGKIMGGNPVFRGTRVPGPYARRADGLARARARVDGREVWRFEAHCLPLTILVRHHWPAMMIDLTGSEKTALNPLWSAP